MNRSMNHCLAKILHFGLVVLVSAACTDITPILTQSSILVTEELIFDNKSNQITVTANQTDRSIKVSGSCDSKITALQWSFDKGSSWATIESNNSNLGTATDLDCSDSKFTIKILNITADGFFSAQGSQNFTLLIRGYAPKMTAGAPSTVTIGYTEKTPYISDVSAPTPTIANSDSAIRWTVTFSEKVTVTSDDSKIGWADTDTVSCNSVSISQAEPPSTTATITASDCAGDGTRELLNLASGFASNGVATPEWSLGGSTQRVEVDNTRPTIESLSGPAPSIGSSSQLFDWTVNFPTSENIQIVDTMIPLITFGGDTADCSSAQISVNKTAAATAKISISGCGAGTFGITQIPAGLFSDGVNSSAALNVTGNLATVDNSTPTVASISAPTPSRGNSSTSLVWTVTFSEAVTVDTTPSLVSLGGSTGSCIKSIAQSNPPSSTATISVTGCAGNGQVYITTIAQDFATDNAGYLSPQYTNNNSATNFATVDNQAPSFLSVTGPTLARINSASTVSWTLTFDDAATIASDAATKVNLGGTAYSDCTKSVAQGATNEKVTITLANCSGNGTVQIASISAGFVSDNLNSTPITTVSSSSAIVDNTVPTISASSRSPAAGNSSTTFTWTITYSENVTATTNSSYVTLTPSGVTCNSPVLAQSSPPSTTSTVSLSGCVGNGTVEIALNSNFATDGVNYTSATIGYLQSATVDNTAPQITALSGPSPTSGSVASSFSWTVSYLENVYADTTDSTKVSLTTTGTASCSNIALSQTAPPNNSSTITVSNCTGNGTVAVQSLGAAFASDSVGNTTAVWNSPSTSATISNPISVTITDTNDDGQIDVSSGGAAGTLWLTGENGVGNEGFMGEYRKGDKYYAYFRFVIDQTIPAGSTINSATLSLYGLSAPNWDNTQALLIRAEASPTPLAPTSAAAHPTVGSAAVSLTSSSVRWPTTVGAGLDWTTNGWNVSPNVTGLITEIFPTLPINTGQAFTFWISVENIYCSDSNGCKVGFKEVSTTGTGLVDSMNPRLVIDFTPP